MGFGSKKKPKSEEPSITDQIKEELENDTPEIFTKKEIQWNEVPIVSTGSTLLDLAISGGRIKYGGIPCCILVEIHGPSGSGKTAILSEIGGNIQSMGGDLQVQDPESRMDMEYARIYGIELFKENYHRPSTVNEVFQIINGWKTDKTPKGLLTDSIAALTTEFELEKGDKMGMRRAKEFSTGLRICARTMSNMLWVASNQERDGENGVTTPGGKGIGYYASLRIRVRLVKKLESEKEFVSTYTKQAASEDSKKKIKGVELKKVIGIHSECYIGKSTVDDPYRTAPIYIIFGYGIDDIRGNLQYVKEMQGLTTYMCPDGKKYMGIEQAIAHIEEGNLTQELKDQVVELWNEAERLFSSNRKRKKVRG